MIVLMDKSQCRLLTILVNFAMQGFRPWLSIGNIETRSRS